MFNRIIRNVAGRHLSVWLIACLAGGFLCSSANAHEFWIEPTQYQIDKDSVIEAYLRNGEEFAGSSVSYVAPRTVRFDLLSPGQSDPVVARMGDNPALKMNPLQEGLNVVVHQNRASLITYTKWDKFQRFAEHKDFPNILERHRERSLPENHFTESYTRYSKSLIAVGHGKGSDRQAGLELELVAEQNPYLDDLSGGIKFTGYYQNEVRSNAQIELFEKSREGDVKITLHRTDEQGEVVLQVKPEHSYLVDMVLLREPVGVTAKNSRVVWETLWASLTFAVP